MAINRIKEVAENRGFKEINPTQDVLDNLDTHLHTWNKWWLKKKDPEIWQLPIIASFLGCEIEDLLDINLKTLKK